MRFVLPIYLLLTSARYALAQGGCYKEWSSLATDIYSAAFDPAFTGNTYTLCKNTFFNAESLSVKIYSSNITIQCGDDGDPNNFCLINGGTYQIFVSEGLQGSPTGVQLKGLTFGPSNMINVVAYGSNIEVELDNCEFKDSTTSSAIGVYANGVGTKININESSFRNNIYLTAIGAVEGAMINVSNSIFFENTVYGSEGVVGVLGTGSSLSLSTSCFISNTIVNATSVVHVETNSFVSSDMEGNFGLNNDPVVNLEFCDGFFDTSCQTFSASYCLANPDITPSATPTSTPSATPSGNPIATPSLSPSITLSLDPTLSPSSLPTVTASEVPSLSPTKPWCYDDWDILTSDIFDATLGAQGGSSALVYYLCPNSVMNASIRPLYLWDDDVNVICGMNGDLSDNCVISGGDYQVYVADHPDRGSPKGVTIKGITFTGQGIASIVVYGIGESQVTIDDCLFENTNNEAAVSIYIGTSTDKKNMVEIHHSQFQKNTLLSVIGNVGGTVSVVKSLFNDNVVLVSSMIN